MADRVARGRGVPLAFLALILAGCTTARPVEGPVRLGQMAAVNGPRVRADRVIEDSRCPADVQCVQAGRLVVRVTVFGGGWSRVIDLELGVPVTVADGRLMLVAATAKPYRFTFDFQGGL